MYKVLVVAYYFPPMGLSGVQRTLKFVKYMKNYNWEPTVLTSGNVAYFAHDKILAAEAENAGIKIIRLGSKEPNSLLSKKYSTVKPPREFVRKILSKISQTFFVPDNKISWSKKAAREITKLLKKETFDIIFITAPPFSSFYHLRKLKKLDVPIMFDYRDLWYGSYFAFYPTPFHKALHKRMEYLSLKAAEKIIVTNRKIKEKLIHTYKFLTFNDVVIIPHGYDPGDFENLQPEPKPNDKMIITYSGIFMEYCTPKYFLRAFKRLALERPDIASQIQLNFVGYLGKENEALIKKLNIEEFIKEFGYVDHKESIKKIISSDLLWLMVGKKKNIDAILPGKLLEYMGARKPIIGCVPEGVARLTLEEYRASFLTEPDNVEQIKDMLLKVFELYKRKELPVPDENMLQKYRRDALTEQLTKQMQHIAKRDVL